MLVLIQMSVCAAQSAPTESISTLVLCGIPLPSCSKVWSGQIYSVSFVSAAHNTSLVKRRRAALNVQYHCTSVSNGVMEHVFSLFFWCFKILNYYPDITTIIIIVAVFTAAYCYGEYTVLLNSMSA